MTLWNLNFCNIYYFKILDKINWLGFLLQNSLQKRAAAALAAAEAEALANKLNGVTKLNGTANKLNGFHHTTNGGPNYQNGVDAEISKTTTNQKLLHSDIPTEQLTHRKIQK